MHTRSFLPKGRNDGYAGTFSASKIVSLDIQKDGVEYYRVPVFEYNPDFDADVWYELVELEEQLIEVEEYHEIAIDWSTIHWSPR